VATGTGDYSGVFTDSAVTAFSQTGGLALKKKSTGEQLMNIVIPSAYAASGNISCIEGTAAQFDATALGDSITFSVTCGTSMDLGIRQELMETLKNHTFLVEYGDGNAAVRQANVTIPNTGARTFTVTVENVQAGKGGCFDDMAFDMDTGIMTYTNNQADSIGGGCAIGAYTGAPNAYTDTMVFRFKDGKVDLDFNETNPQFEVGNADYVRWCLDDNSNGVCD